MKKIASIIVIAIATLPACNRQARIENKINKLELAAMDFAASFDIQHPNVYCNVSGHCYVSKNDQFIALRCKYHGCILDEQAVQQQQQQNTGVSAGKSLLLGIVGGVIGAKVTK